MKAILAGLAVVPLVLFSSPSQADPAALTPQTPIEVPGGPGHFDFVEFDADNHRVLACHPGGKNLVVLDTKTNTVTTVDTGAVNGIAIDTADNRYYAAGPGQHISIIDRDTLKETSEIPLDGPGDDVEYDTKSGQIYVCNDDGTKDWVVDPKTNTIVATVTIAGAPEVVDYDAATDKLYQNIKPTDQVQVIDPSTNSVTATWSTAPVDSPHGLALDAKRGHIFSAGKNGKLVEIDVNTGQVISSCDIAKGVDQIAFNAQTREIYCACTGAISIVKVSKKKGLTPIADVPLTSKGHNVAVDPDTQAIWIAYNDTTASYLQEFVPATVAEK